MYNYGIQVAIWHAFETSDLLKLGHLVLHIMYDLKKLGCIKLFKEGCKFDVPVSEDHTLDGKPASTIWCQDPRA
jgi:hypothetical protein